MVSLDQLDWLDKIPIAEFAVNSAVNASTFFTPFELNYGYLPRSMSGIKTSTPFTGVRAFAEKARDNIVMTHDAVLEARTLQTRYANTCKQEEPPIHVDEMVYLSIKSLSFPKGRARKLVPKYIGPY